MKCRARIGGGIVQPDIARTGMAGHKRALVGRIEQRPHQSIDQGIGRTVARHPRGAGGDCFHRAAIARIGTNASPAQLMSVAEPLIPWITRPPAKMCFRAPEGDPMPLTVDSVNSAAVLSFTDDHDDAVARFLFEKTNKRPIVIPVVLGV